jgi:hypothetical protein
MVSFAVSLSINLVGPIAREPYVNPHADFKR